ncbi:MAG: carbohydrate ABC transporter permease [Christensenellales bacterium]
MSTKKKKYIRKESWVCWTLLILLAVIALLPLCMVLSASLTEETYIQKNGYTLFPVNPSLATFKFLIANKGRMLMRAIQTTLSTVVCGTIYAVSVVTCFAYAVSQKQSDFLFARALSFFAWFTTIFSGGVLPWYILCTQHYGLRNNLYALFIPYGMSVWNMFILRGNFRQIPEPLFESAKLDGASDAQIFVKISIPLARAGIITISLFNVLGFWNDFFLPKWLITESSMQTLQLLLYNMLSNAQALLRNSELSDLASKVVIPTQTAKMAVAVMAILPIIAMYPFALKHFVKGINVGGIKG